MAQSDQGLLAIFWDIENCRVPRGKSAVSVAHCIRERFLHPTLKEAEFLCVCDVSKEPASVLSELNDAQVTVVHVSGEHKNAADDKLKQCMRKFCDSHKPPVTLVLISADTDFAADLSHMRNHHNYDIILVHNKPTVRQALAITAHKIYRFEDVVKNAPEKELLNNKSTDRGLELHLVHISGLPVHADLGRVRTRLYTLVQNTKGTVLQCGRRHAIVKYSKAAHAERAVKRLSQQDIYFSKLICTYLTNPDTSTSMGQSPVTSSLKASCASPTSPLNSSLPAACNASTPLFPGSARHNHAATQSLHSSLPHYPTQWPKSTEQEKNKVGDVAMNLSAQQTGAGNFAPNFSTSSCTTTARSARVSLFQGGTTPKHPRWTNCATLDNLYRAYNPPVTTNWIYCPNPAALQTASRMSSIPTSVLRTYNNNVPPVKPNITYAQQGNTTLIVTNLGSRITADQWANIIHSVFKQYVHVSRVNMERRADNSLVAFVHVLTEENARYAISKCHGKKLGYHCIDVALHTPSLSDNPPKRLPGKRITVEDLFKKVETKEAVNSNHKEMPPLTSLGQPAAVASSRPADAAKSHQGKTAFCPIHCSLAEFTLVDERGMLPYVKVELKAFTSQLHQLLKQHEGKMHLMSFTFCYESLFNKLVSTSDGGVPLEHLISCVSGVQILLVGNVKMISSSRSNRPPSSASSTSGTSSTGDGMEGQGHSDPAVKQRLAQFSQEVIDLLKHKPNRQMSVSMFIPSYHHHFGRQCRLADFGFTKLEDLFGAIPRVIQILGTGSQSVLYLTHEVHVSNFTADLCQVLKAQTGEQCTVKNFPNKYREVMGAELRMSNYGVCYINDILPIIPVSKVFVLEWDGSTVMCIPRTTNYGKSSANIQKLEEFAYEVIDLFRSCSLSAITLTKFIPAYHHHFGRQFRVSDFGFSKLIDLFHAIPETVDVKENEEGMYISLTKDQHLKVFAERILSLLKNSHFHSVMVRDLTLLYRTMFGHELPVKEIGAASATELVEQIPHIAYVSKKGTEEMVTLTNRSEVECLAGRCLSILLLKTNGVVTIPGFIQRYQESFRESVNIMKLKQSLYPAVIISLDDHSGKISLHPLLMLARRIISLLSHHYGKLSLANFEVAYKQSFGVSLANSQAGHLPLQVLLQMMDFMVSLSGRGENQTILLRQNHIARLAHQLAYKVGIYPELVKHDDLKNHLSIKINRPSSSERITGEGQILAGSSDVFVNKTGTRFTEVPCTPSSSANASNMYKRSSPAKTLSIDLSKISSEDLARARIALNSLKLSPTDKLHL